MNYLLQDLLERWPLFNRRLAFFRSEHGQGKEVSAWLSKLEELSIDAEISALSTEEVMIFHSLCGISNTKIRHELKKLKEPSLKEIKQKVIELEVSKRMKVSLDKKQSLKLTKVSSSANKSSKGQSYRNFQRSIQGKCLRGGSSKHRRSGCDRQNLWGSQPPFASLV